MPVPQGQYQRKAFTVFGCIGSALRNGFYIEFEESTHKWAFHNFVQNLALQLKDEYTNTLPALVIDNHKSHDNLDCRNTMCKYFQPEFIPPYSC